MGLTAVYRLQTTDTHAHKSIVCSVQRSFTQKEGNGNGSRTLCVVTFAMHHALQIVTDPEEIHIYT